MTGGLARLQLIMEIDGDKAVVVGLTNVDQAVDRTAAATNQATGRMAESMNSTTAATGRMAAGMGDVEKASGRMAATHGGHVKGIASEWSAFETALMQVQFRLMNLTMAAGMLAAPFVAAGAVIKYGLDLLGEFQTSTIQIASQLTQMQGPKNVAFHYQESVRYAGALAEKLQEVDANSFANSKGLQAMLQTMTMQGVVLDVNNKKQVDAFTALSNTIAMNTQGQDQQIQSYQEMRSLMSGQIDMHSQVSRQIDQAIKQEGIYKGGLKEVVELGKQHGDTLERLVPYLVGANAASADINRTWQAAQSSMSTTISMVVRAGWKETIVDVTGWLQTANVYLKEHSAEIGGRIREGWQITRTLIEGSFQALQVGGMVLQTTIIPLFSDTHLLIKGTRETIQAVGSVLQQAPGLLVPVGVAVYYAVGGLGALTVAYAALTTTITASMAANPIGWVALGIGAVTMAAKPAVKYLDEMIYKYTELNLTGEAFYNAELKRAAAADKAWEDQKKKAMWMYQEGGIPLSPAMRAELPLAPKIAPPPPKTDNGAAAKAASEAESWRKAVADLNSEIVKLDPTLSKHEKSVDQIDNKFADLLAKYPKHRAELLDLKQQTIDMTAVNEAYKNELDSVKEMERLRAEGAKDAAAAYIDYTQSIHSFMDSLRQDAEEQAKVLAELLSKTIDLQNSNIDDPYARQMAQMETRYKRERDQIKLTMAAYKENLQIQAAGQAALHQLTISQEKETYDAKLNIWASGLSTFASILDGMASLADQNSRAGFEEAKDYAYGAAVVNTAAAVMRGYSESGWYGALAAGALGAIQIAKINATSYGGGSGSVSISGGSFGGGSSSSSAGVGSARGDEYSSVQDNQSLEAMQRLTASVDNASMAMRKVSSGLVVFADMLSGNGALGTAPGRFTDLTYEKGYGSKIGNWIMDTSGYKTTNFIKDGDWSGLNNQMKSFNTAVGNILFGYGNKWQTNAAGVALGVESGQLSGQEYTTFKKDGGVFRKDKYRTEYSELSDGFAVMLEGAIRQITSNTNLAATIMGTSGNIAGVNIPQANIATAGRAVEDIQKDIEAWLQSVGNEFAKTVEGLEAVALPGEEAYAALMRLAMALQTVNSAFELTGKTLIDSSLQGGNQASKLVELMGGTDAFNEKMSTYFTEMFTEAEQAAAQSAQATREVTVAFAEMGIVAPQTRAEFNALAARLDVTTASGAALYAALMDVVPAFKLMTDAIDEATTTMIDGWVDSWRQGAETMLEAAEQNVAFYKQVKESALAAIAAISGGSLSILSPEAKYAQARLNFQNASVLANQGDRDSLSKLPELGNALLEISRQYNASGAAYVSDYERVMQALSASAESAAYQQNANEQLVTLGTDQVNLLGNILEELRNPTAEHAAYLESQLAALAATAANITATNQALAVGGPIATAVSTTNTEVLPAGFTDLAQKTLQGTQTLLSYYTASGYAEVARSIAAEAAIRVTELQTQIASLPVSGTDPVTGIKTMYNTGYVELALNNQLAEARIAAASAAESVALAQENYLQILAEIQNAIHLQSVPAFAAGGITPADSFYRAGESPEAIIPLPDGRTVPVRMQGAATNKGMEERLDKVIVLLDSQEKRLANIETKARLVVNE